MSAARSWSVWTAIPIVLVALIAGVLAFSIAAAIHDALLAAPVRRAGLAGVAAHGSPPALTIASTLAQDLVLAGGVLVAVRLALGATDLAAIGLRPTRPVRAAAWVVAAYVVFAVVSTAWASALGITDRENVAVGLGTRDSAWALVGSGLLVGAVAPIAEELFFRGFVFGALRRHGLALAAGLSGLAFGGAHVASSPIGFLVPLALLGVILCLLYERTGSLYPGIALHAINNAIAFGVSDGRGWVAPACLVASGAAVVAILAALRRLPGAAAAAPGWPVEPVARAH